MKLHEYSYSYTILQYKRLPLQLKRYNSDMFRPFLVGHPQGVYINIYTKVDYKYIK